MYTQKRSLNTKVLFVPANDHCVKKLDIYNDTSITEKEDMTSKRSKLKRTLAREILFFFAGITLIVLVWGFLFIRNYYYEKKVNSCSNKLKIFQLQSDNLPKDYIKDFYDQTSRYFVLNYRIGQENYAIPKEQLEVFLYDEFGIKKNTTLLPNHHKGYSYFKRNYVNIKPNNSIYFSSKEDLGEKVKKLYPEYADIVDFKLGNLVLKKFNQCSDSIIVFDFVSINKFREFVSSDDYLEKLFTVFANIAIKTKWVPPVNAVRADFDPLNPYKSTFPLGSLSEFKGKMKIGLKFNSTILEKKNKLETEILDQKKTLTDSKYKKLNSNEIINFLIYSALIIFLLIYVIRLSIVLILWAIKNINQNNV